MHYDAETGRFSRRAKTEPISHDRVKEVLNYNPETGVFRWRKKISSKVVAGEEAGQVKQTHAGSYRYVGIDGERYLAHRLAWFWMYGYWPRLVSFRDENSLNCAIDNLEVVGDDVAGSRKGTDYLYVRVDGRDYTAARLAWFYVHGRWPGLIRFRDGDKYNCAIANLRDSTVEHSYDTTTEQRYADLRKARYQTNRDRARDLDFQRKYGITLNDYRRMEKDQGGVCAICGQPETGERNGKPRFLAVDHDHDTGKVRGLLCGKCNPGIGYFDHDADLLECAIAYLKRTE
jgi:hypothetical protein